MYQISEFELERRNQNTNKIKYSEYLKHNNPIQTVVRLHFRYLSLNYPRVSRILLKRGTIVADSRHAKELHYGVI